MRYTFWQLKDLQLDDLQSRLVIADNANGRPDEIKRLQMRWRNGDDSRVALVPTFEERVVEFVPPWLLQAIESGNVQPVFVIDGEKPDIDAVVALSVIHYFIRIHGDGLLREWGRVELFPRGPVPFVRCTTTLLAGGDETASTPRASGAVLLWHSGYVHNATDEIAWGRLFANLDLAWCRYIVGAASWLKLRLEEAVSGDDGAWLPALLMQAFLLKAVHVFRPLMPWAAADLDRILSEEIDGWLLSDLRCLTSSPWRDLQRKLRDRDIYAKVEERVEAAILNFFVGTRERESEVGLPNDWDTAEQLVSNLAEIGKEFSGPLFKDDLPEREHDGGDAGNSKLDESAPPNLRVLREEDATSLRKVSPPERFLSMVYTDRHGSRWTEALLANVQSVERQQNSATSTTFCLSPNDDHCFSLPLKDTSRWNLIHGCHWLRNVPEGFASPPTFAAGSSIKLWPPVRMIVDATDITGSGIAAYTLEIGANGSAAVRIAVVPEVLAECSAEAVGGGQSTPNTATPSPLVQLESIEASEAMSDKEVRRSWEQLKVRIKVDDSGELVEPPHVEIQKASKVPRKRLTPAELKQFGFLDKRNQGPTETLRLLASVKQDATTGDQYIEVPERSRKQVNELGKKLAACCGYKRIPGYGKDGAPVGRGKECDQGHMQYPLCFKVECFV